MGNTVTPLNLHTTPVCKNTAGNSAGADIGMMMLQPFTLNQNERQPQQALGSAEINTNQANQSNGQQLPLKPLPSQSVADFKLLSASSALKNSAAQGLAADSGGIRGQQQLWGAGVGAAQADDEEMIGCEQPAMEHSMNVNAGGTGVGVAAQHRSSAHQANRCQQYPQHSDIVVNQPHDH